MDASVGPTRDLRHEYERMLTEASLVQSGAPRAAATISDWSGWALAILLGYLVIAIVIGLVVGAWAVAGLRSVDEEGAARARAGRRCTAQPARAKGGRGAGLVPRNWVPPTPLGLPPLDATRPRPGACFGSTSVAPEAAEPRAARDSQKRHRKRPSVTRPRLGDHRPICWSASKGSSQERCGIFDHGLACLSVECWAHSLQRAGDSGTPRCAGEGVGGDVEICGVLHPQE